MVLNYIYEVENLTTFNHKIEILKEDIDFNTNNTNLINNLVFHIGLVDLVSYWKATCSPNIIIECGNLEEEQKEWFKKLYYYGLGEMLYVNNITVSLNDFVKIECLGSQIEYEVDDTKRSDYLIKIHV